MLYLKMRIGKNGFYFTRSLFCDKTQKEGTRKLPAGGDGSQDSGGLYVVRDPQDKDPGTVPLSRGFGWRDQGYSSLLT